MTVLVTGAGGYIPTQVIKTLLERGCKVIGVDNAFGRGLDGLIEHCGNRDFEFIKGDIGDDKILNKLEGKIDAAVLAHALVGEPLCDKYPELAEYTNVKTIEKFTEKFPNVPIVYTGTGSSFGKVEGVCNEESPCNPLSLYAKTKLQAEQIIQKSNPHVIYRFATAFGLATSSFRIDLLVNDLVYQACKNRTIVLFQPEFRRTFCHVRDLSDSIVYAIFNFNRMKGNLYCVGNKNNNWTKLQLAEFIQSKTNCSLFVGASGYKDTDQRDYDCDFSKINNAGWFANISMEEGIEELIKCWPLLNMKNQYNFVG
jgi:nucleoside-diphosphate-sugar epimerase